MVVPHGIEPRSRAYRARTLPLSYGTENGGARTESNLMPARDCVYSAARDHLSLWRAPLELVPGTDPGSAPYRSAALPLCYTSGGEPSSRNSPAVCAGAALSRRARRPRRLTLQLAEGEGIEPLARRLPWFSRPVAGHSAAPSVEWYWRPDSNRHHRRSERRASANWATPA